DDFDQELRESGVETEFEDILLLELKGPMSFAVARGLNRRLAEQGEHKTLIIDLTRAQLLGVTTSLVVLDVIEDEQAKGRTVVLVGVDSPAIAESFERMGIFEKVPPALRFKRIDDIWSS
ncbi:MAG: STAS domain-containing protein, partial [Pseudomonadales bacterium]